MHNHGTCQAGSKQAVKREALLPNRAKSYIVHHTTNPILELVELEAEEARFWTPVTDEIRVQDDAHDEDDDWHITEL